MDWVNNLKDRIAQRNIAVRLRRASFGNFGDCKPIKEAKGLWEMREHYGNGYRIFYVLLETRLYCFWRARQKKTKRQVSQKQKTILQTTKGDKPMPRKAGRPFDFGNLDVMKDPEQAALYLEEILADGDIEMFKEALKDVAAARVGKMTTLAKKTHLARKLYILPFPEKEIPGWIHSPRYRMRLACACRSQRHRKTFPRHASF